MAKFVIVSQRLLGHLLPVLGAGTELRRRGHRLTVITAGGHRALVEGAGMTYRENGWGQFPDRFIAELLGDLLEAFRGERPDAVICDSSQAAAAYAAEKLGIPWISFQTTVPLPDRLVPGKPAVNRRLRQLYGEKLHAVRQRFGLPPLEDPARTRGDFAALSPLLHLLMVLPELIADPAAIPPVGRVVGICAYESSDAWQGTEAAGLWGKRSLTGGLDTSSLPDASGSPDVLVVPDLTEVSGLTEVLGDRWLPDKSALPDEPGEQELPDVSGLPRAPGMRGLPNVSGFPDGCRETMLPGELHGRNSIVVCTSSVPHPQFRHRIERYVSASLKAFGGGPYKLMVTAPEPYDGKEPLAANIRWLTSYPIHHLLLPGAAAAITHGGCGTLQKNMKYGVPMVIIPLGADHSLLAERCRQLGTALVVDPDEATPDRLRDAVQELVDPASGFLERADRLGQAIRRMRPNATAADHIERLLANQRG